jgi:hypothetical protein
MRLPNEYDGFRAELFESKLKSQFELYIVLFAGGKRVAQYLVRALPCNVDGAALADREFFLLQAMCRYMNQGGEPGQIERMVTSVDYFLGDRDLSILPPWKLLSVVQPVDESTVVYVNDDTGECVVIKEDDYVEQMTVHELAERLNVKPYGGPTPCTQIENYEPNDGSTTQEQDPEQLGNQQVSGAST